MSNRKMVRRMRLSLLQFAAAALSAVCVCVPVAAAQSATGTVSGTVSPLLAGATDMGALPVSQPVGGVVVQLQTTAAQQADLAQFLASVMWAGSQQYHQWLTPAQFADHFGASAADVATLTAWLGVQGLQVDLVAQSRGFVVVSGTAAQVESAFGVQLDRFLLANGGGFANTADPVLPANIAALIANISGLNSFPYGPAAAVVPHASANAAVLNAAPLTAQGLNGTGIALGLANAGEAAAAAAIAPQAGMSDGALLNEEPLLAAALGIDGNANPVMRVAGGCASALTSDEMAWFESVAMQANAQGITLVAATHDCATGAAFPAIMSEVTAVGKLPAVPSVPAKYTVMQPPWQSAADVPADGLRHTPDVSVNATADAGDAASFAGALALVVQKANGARQGNVNGILYSIANDAGVFTQTSSAPVALAAPSTGTTTAASYDTLSGLGVPDITAMLDVWPLGSTASNTSITSNAFSPTYGQSVTLTATVTTGATGSVTFMDGSSTLGSANLSGGSVNTAALTLSTLTGGTHTITATYTGDSTYAASTSGTATVTVLPQNATITATVSGTQVLGEVTAVSITVAGTSGAAAPTGIVTVTVPGGTNSTGGTATLVAGSGNTSTATAHVSIGQAGTFTLQVSCASGDQNFSCSSPTSTQVTMPKGATTTTLTASPNPPTGGSPVTLTAVTADGLLAQGQTGTVTFYDGTTSLGTGSLTGDTATLSTTLSPGKTHSLTAVYGGDSNWLASTSSVLGLTAGTIPSTTGLSSSTYASTYGSNVTFTATVAANSSATTTLTPTGLVSFYANGTLLGTGTLASGVASYSTTALPVGLESITATYAGDTNFAASTSTVYNGVTVSAATGTLTASISPSPTPYGSTATITATLTLSGGGTPVGTITATVPGTGGGTYMGALVANTGGSATATIVVNAPPPGTYTITVACPTATTTANYTCTPTTVSLTTTKGATATTVSFSPAAPYAGQTTTVTALVSNAGAGTGSYVFTGSVTFYDNGAAVGTAAVSGNQASTSITFKANVVHSIVAVYSGDTNWIGSTSSATPITAIASPTTTTLTSNYTTALYGTNLILTANVAGTTGVSTIVPTGLVTFYDSFNGVVATLGTGALISNGPYASLAQLTTTGLQDGAHDIFAIYAGDNNYATSTSTTLIITEQDYSLVFNPATLTLNRGQSGQVAVILGTVGGFTGTITFGCTPPADTETTCSFLPATVASGGSTTLFIGTSAPNAKEGTVTAGNLAPVLLPFTIAGLLLLLPGRRSRLRAGLLVLLLAAGLANTGCTHVIVGGSGTTTGTGSTGTATSGTPLGSNTFTITTAGTSTGSNGTYTVRHTTTYMVTTQ